MTPMVEGGTNVASVFCFVLTENIQTNSKIKIGRKKTDERTAESKRYARTPCPRYLQHTMQTWWQKRGRGGGGAEEERRRDEKSGQGRIIRHTCLCREE